MAAAPSRSAVLVVAEDLDATADMVVDQLNARGVPVVRFDTARYPQQLTLTAEQGRSGDWAGVLDTGARSVRLADVAAVYWRRPARPIIDPAVPGPYAEWAVTQAEAAMLNVLDALPVRWINNPHWDRIASHKPQQLPLAAACGLTVPRTLVTNDPVAARDFAKTVGQVVCKPILGGRITDDQRGRLMVPTHPVDVADIDDTVRLTAHLFQEQIPKAFEVRLTVVDGHLFPAAIHAASDQALQDWRTDTDAISLTPIETPDYVAAAVRAYLAYRHLTFGAFDFAVTPDGDWAFFECNSTGTWGWVEQKTGLPIAAAHAAYLAGDTA